MFAFADVQMLDVMGPLEVFSRTTRWLRDHRGRKESAYEVEILGLARGPIRASSGLRLYVDRSIDEVRRGIDTLLIAGGMGMERHLSHAPLLRWLQRQSRVVRRLGSICTGAFFLAEAGLLAGLRATTHWGSSAKFARRYPDVRVEPDRIFVREGSIYTSGGVTAGMDLALALVEEDFGGEVALAVARELVMFLRRPGGQAQFSAQLAGQFASQDSLRDLQAYIIEHPEEDHSVPGLARRAAMSSRNFARIFTREVGATPARFVTSVRVETARRLLEETADPLETICARTGLGTPENLRRAFIRVLGIPPGGYRERFRNSADSQRTSPKPPSRIGSTVMKNLRHRLTTHLALLIALVGLAVARAALADGADHAKGTQYVCPPCGMACDHAAFDKPGTCPVCGATLVSEDARKAATRRVVILLFDGVEIIDFTGPYEVFGGAGYDVVTVAETRDPVTTAMGMKVVPAYGLADVPHADVVVVPGGSVRAAKENPALLRWVKQATAHADHTLSVCNGAFILANAGLLDGLTVTTTAHWIETLAREFPKTKVVADQRFVDNGKIITAAGLSAGIDGALHVVAVTDGAGTAQATALGLEYDWRPNDGFARAALADQKIPDIDLDALGTWTIERTEGKKDRWELVVRGASPLSAPELEDRLAAGVAAHGWTRTAPAVHGVTALWRFADATGAPWTGATGVESVPGEGKHYVLRCTVARGDAKRGT